MNRLRLQTSRSTSAGTRIRRRAALLDTAEAVADILAAESPAAAGPASSRIRLGARPARRRGGHSDSLPLRRSQQGKTRAATLLSPICLLGGCPAPRRMPGASFVLCDSIWVRHSILCIRFYALCSARRMPGGTSSWGASHVPAPFKSAAVARAGSWGGGVAGLR